MYHYMNRGVQEKVGLTEEQTITFQALKSRQCHENKIKDRRIKLLIAVQGVE